MFNYASSLGFEGNGSIINRLLRIDSKIFLSVLLSVLVALLFVGCARKVDDGGHSEQGKILLIGNSREPSSLDPHVSGSWAALKIKDGLFEGLVSVDGADLSPVPGVAERWDVSADGLIYRFHLRKDARWSDGQLVSSNDFYESLRRLLSPAMGTDMPSLFLYDIEGAQEYHQGESSDFASVGIRKVGDDGIEFTLKHPNSYFLSAMSYVFPVPVHQVLAWGNLDDRSNPWMQDGRGVYNGPYVLKSWVSHDRIVLVRNSYYWDVENVAIEEIHFLPISSVNTEELAFRRGEIHVTSKVPPARIAFYERENKEVVYFNNSVLGTFFLQFNTVHPVLSDIRVRQALALAIDKQALVEGVMKDGKKAASLLFPLSSVRSADLFNRYDPVKARELLLAAGYGNGNGFPRLRLSYNTSETYQQLMEAIQFMWRDNLGIEIELVNQEWSVFLDSLDRGDFDIGRYGFIPPYPDPVVMLSVLSSSGYGNFTSWSDATYDGLVTTAREAGVLEKRQEMTKAAALYLDEQMPIVPIFYYNSVYLKDAKLGGWEGNLMDRHPLKQLYWK